MSDVTLHQHKSKKIKSAEGRINIPRWSHQLTEINSLKISPFHRIDPDLIQQKRENLKRL
jgi:hypothetical protein